MVLCDSDGAEVSDRVGARGGISLDVKLYWVRVGPPLVLEAASELMNECKI